MKKRESYLDIAKGILILFLLLHHTPIQGDSTMFPKMEVIKIFVLYYGPFFMAAFFLISGYCTNFNKKFVDFISSTAKGIILPMISFTIIVSVISYFVNGDSVYFTKLLTPGYYLYPSGYWFFAALIEVRSIVWLINRYININKLVLGLSYAVGFFGLWVNKNGETPQYTSLLAYQQAMMAFPFVITGVYLKRSSLNIDKLSYIGLSYVVIVILMTILKKPTPDWTFVMAMKPIHYPLFVVLALSGSALVVWGSYKINHNKALEFVGKNSLVFYGMNFVVFNCIRPLFMSLFDMNDYFHIVLWSFLVFISALFILCLVTYIFNTKYFRFLIGRF